jgi:hypothetical protein
VTLALLCAAVAPPVAAAASPPDAAGGPNITGSTGSATDGDTFVVDDDGGADYRSIAAAVANASDGDTVRVRPGTYGGGIELAANVTVVAPRGATVSGPGFDANESVSDTAFRVVSGSHAAPVVSGFTVTGFFDGVSAWNTTGDWVVRDTAFEYPMGNAIRAISSRGDWRAENVTVRNASEAVVAIDAEGDWVVEDSTFRGAEHGVEAASATGDWTLRNVTVTNDAGAEVEDYEVTLVGVAARNASGDWSIEDSTVRNAVVGVSAYETSGNWTVADTTFRNVTESERYDFMMPPLPEGVGVVATRATGSWSVRESTFVGVTGAGIDAIGTAAGTAVDNEFRAARDADRCVGNVRCGSAGGTPTPSPTTAGPSTPTDAPSTPTPSDASPPPGTTDVEPTRSPTPADPGETTPSPTPDRTETAGDGRLPAWLAVLSVLIAGLLVRRIE